MDQLKVQKLIVGAQPPNLVEPQSSAKVNHWLFYLQTCKNASVSLDMAPSGNAGKRDKDGTVGILLVKDLDYGVSRTVVKRLEVSLTSSVTVKDLVSALEDKGYEHYDFNKLGIGCRY